MNKKNKKSIKLYLTYNKIGKDEKEMNNIYDCIFRFSKNNKKLYHHSKKTYANYFGTNFNFKHFFST